MADSWAIEASSSSSPSLTSPNFKYDVFLSFSGIDTRKKFIGHLLAALKRHGIYTFIDETKLNRGEDIGPALLKAIEESRISLIVFSKNYSESRWCLDELVKIMECKETFQQTVLPIFYDVEPSDVRVQKGSLAEAFAKHEERFKEGGSNGTVEKWKKALTKAANLSGWDLSNTNEHEAKYIEKIAEGIRHELSFADLHVAEHPVGLKSRIKNLKTMVNMDSNDVRIVGIWGIGGIGKTTIAKMLYNLIHGKFEGSSFLANVRETWRQSNGPVVLQQQLLSEIVKNETFDIRNSNRGIEFIKGRVLCRKVLLVLDDVDNAQQLKALAIDRDYFCPGSRIIITTRDKSILNFLNVDEIYEPKSLNTEESLQLFSWYAFKEDHPMKDYVELSYQVVDYTEGLPLALVCLGSLLCGKEIGNWKSAIEKLRKIPHDDIQGKLKISYDSLTKEEKELFLDIACFFIGMDQDFMIKILEGCNFHAKIGIRILANRCLVRFGHENQLEMHNLLRDMGREIVRQESPKEPGERSRLWNPEDSLEVLINGTGTAKVEGLILNFPKSEEVQVSEKVIEKMNEIRLLHLNYVHLRSGFEHSFGRLLWLSWKGCQLEWLSSELYMEKLVALDLRNSMLKLVWKGTKNLDKLKFLYLSHCYDLIKTPDFSGLNNLEELWLNDCIRLVEIDKSIGCLKNLVVLDMANCKELGPFPLRISMLESLEYLDLSGCFKLTELRGNVDSIGLSLQGPSCLKKLKMANCNLSNMPSEIGSLISLIDLDLSDNNLYTLPNSTCNLTCLENLDLAYNSVSHLPSEIGRLISLTHLDLTGNKLCTLPESFGKLTCLQNLDMSGCNVQHLPYEIGSLVLLTHLDLTGNNLCTLPDSICNLVCLKELFISNCNLSELPSEIGGLISLEELILDENNICTLPDSICNLTRLGLLCMEDCNLSHLPNEIWRLNSLGILHLSGNNFRTLPDGICKLTELEYLELEDCARLQSLPELPAGIILYASGCVSLENIELKSLVGGQHGTCMDFCDCPKLAENNLANNFIEFVIQKLEDYHGLESSSDRHNRLYQADTHIHLCGDDVPRWFEYQSTGPYLSFKVPPLLINQRILGLFLCVVFIGSKEKFGGGHFWCDIHTNKVRKVGFPHSGRGYCRISGEDQMWLRFTTVGQLEGGDEVEFSITDYTLIQIKKCAANIVLAETNDKALTQYTSSPYQSLILEEEEEEEEEVDYPAKK